MRLPVAVRRGLRALVEQSVPRAQAQPWPRWSSSGKQDRARGWKRVRLHYLGRGGSERGQIRSLFADVLAEEAALAATDLADQGRVTACLDALQRAADLEERALGRVGVWGRVWRWARRQVKNAGAGPQEEKPCPAPAPLTSQGEATV